MQAAGDVGAGTRPRTTRGEQTAARLRQAAREVFSRLGYAAARVEDIVADAGVSHGTFYTYYENRAAVLDALIDEAAAALTEVVEAPWVGPDVEHTIEGVIGRFVEVFASYQDVVRVWVEASAHEVHFRERLRQVRDGYVGRVAEHLRPALAMTPHDASVAAAALVAMVEGAAVQGANFVDGETRDRTVATLAGLWYGGLVHLSQGS